MNQCKYTWIDPKTKREMRCKKKVIGEYCCVHDPNFHTGCRYSIRNWNKPFGLAEAYCARCGDTYPIAVT